MFIEINMHGFQSAGNYSHIAKRAAMALVFGASMVSSIWAAQDVTLVSAAGASLGGSQSVSAGASITLVGRYSVSSPQTGNEVGLGLKLKYDASKFSSVVVNSYVSKCAIATPEIQPGGSNTQIVMGWLDTAIRPNGSVGWPASADIADPAGCLEFSTVVEDDAAKALPLDLFSITFTTATAYGTATIQLLSDGNVSFANSSTAADFTKNLVLSPPVVVTPTVSMSASSATLVDSANNVALITVSVDVPAPAGGLLVALTPPAANARYSTSCVSPIFIAAGATTATCTVTATANTTLLDGNVTAALAIAAGNGYVLGANSSTSVAVNNDDFCNLDIDGDNAITANRDGLLVSRYLAGYSGSALIDGMSPPIPAGNLTLVQGKLAALAPYLNLKGSTPALGNMAFDGLLLYRVMAGLNGTALVGSLQFPAGSTRTTSTQIIGHVNAMCGTNYPNP